MKIKLLNYELEIVRRTEKDPLFKERMISVIVLYIAYLCITIPLQPSLWVALPIYTIIVFWNTFRETSIKDTWNWMKNSYGNWTNGK